MATPRRALGNVTNNFGSAVKATPRRALGDVKNNFGSATKLSNVKELNHVRDSTYKGNVIDFTEEENENIVKPELKKIPTEEIDNPIDKCSCDHAHRNENYTLIDDTIDFFPVEKDVCKADEWSTYYSDVENNITTWQKFLEDNDMI